MPRGAAARRQGFSLIEILVVMGILTIFIGALTPSVIQQLNARRVASTRKAMEELLAGILGDAAQGDFGFVGDVGAAPAALERLNDGVGIPAFSPGSSGIGYGWNGPYAPRVRLGSAGSFVDGWDQPLLYSASPVQIRSAGPDRTAGNADDIVVPPVPVPLTGDLVVRVLGAPNTGDPASLLSSLEADVFVRYASGGSQQEAALAEPSGGPGPFTITGLHGGPHVVRAVGEGAYAGAPEVRDVAILHRGTVVLTVVLEQP